MSEVEVSDYHWHYLSHSSTRRFGPLVLDYLNSDDKLKEFYEHRPAWDSFSNQIEERSSFPQEKRETLVQVLKEQYAELASNDKLDTQIESLRNFETFTVATGQQLCLFTGPLYVIYKAVHVVKLAQELASRFPEKKFVPIFWLASEDHDYEEVNHFNFEKNKFSVDRETEGAVGRTPLPDLNAVMLELESLIGTGKTQASILRSLDKAYGEKGVSWSLATREFMHDILGHLGLILLDADDSRLKKEVASIFREELLNSSAAKAAMESSKRLDKIQKVQAFPREINLFYLSDKRKRIIRTESGFAIDGEEKKWTQEDLLSELELHPERFSPNVLLRPLYQECILPNLAYIGGGAEVAYWAQLRSVFTHFQIPMPIILLRQSIQLISRAQIRRMEKADLELKDLFQDQDTLIKSHVIKRTDIDLELKDYVENVTSNFDEIHEIAKKTDKSMIGAVEAQRTRQLKGLANLRKKLLRAEKKRFSEGVERIEILLDELFPNGGLQERRMNWIEAELMCGGGFIDELIKGTDPLGSKFACIVLND